MKKFKLLSIGFAAMLLIFSGACSNDDTDETSKYVGSYQIKSATLAADLSIVTDGGNVVVPAGAPITDAIKQALLGAAACTSPNNTYIELKSDQSIFMVCKDENKSLNAGTWAESNATDLALNLNATALPPFGYQLTVKDVTLESNVLSGGASIPLPKAMVEGILSEMLGNPITLPANPPVIMFSINLEFMKE